MKQKECLLWTFRSFLKSSQESLILYAGLSNTASPRISSPNPWNLWMLPSVANKKQAKEEMKVQRKEEDRLCRCDWIKHFQMGSLFWIIYEVPKCSLMYPYKGVVEGYLTLNQKKSMGPQKLILEWFSHKPKNANSHQKLEVARNGLSHRVSRGSGAVLTPLKVTLDFYPSGLWGNKFL